MMNPTDLPFQLLREERRRQRGILLVWSLAAALAGNGLAWASRLNWVALDVGWAWIPEAFAVGLLGWWVKRVWRLDQVAVARTLDAQWALHSRLETALELAPQTSALALAQRAEVSRLIAERRPSGGGLWFGGLASVALALCLLSTEGAVLARRGSHLKPESDTGKPAETEKALVAEARASIEWKSPESEIKATAIEEVPWVAYSNSTTGLKTLTLIVEVNGETKVTRAIEDTSTSAFGTPGGHEIPSSLYLDELGVKPFDVVSYHLIGDEHPSSRGARRVLSVPQFVQIRELSQELRLGGGGAAFLAKLLTELKDLQLRRLKENFLLLQTSDAQAEPVWKKENGRVAAEQEKLRKKAEIARALAVKDHASGLILSNLKEAGELMTEAASQIAQTQNDHAAKRQTRALALITECQKFFAMAISEQPVDTANDPFRDDQRFRLPPREETPAGELEMLAQRQREANARLNGINVEGPAISASASEQEAIGRQAATLADRDGLDPRAREGIKTASEAAQAAARQLAAKDLPAAREPAAVSQAALEQAVAAQESAGRASAVAVLEQSRRELNTASRMEDSAQRSQILDATRAALRTAAVAQQRTGSAEAARWLAELTEQLTAPGSKPGTSGASGSRANSDDRAREVAAAAAGAQVALASPAAAMSRATRTLRRAQATLFASGAAAAERTRSLADLELAAQEAEWLTGDTEAVAQARKLTTEVANLQRATAVGGDEELRHVVEAANQLALALEKARERGKRDERVRSFNPEDVDPAYRAAVEVYFERLSREAVKH